MAESPKKRVFAFDSWAGGHYFDLWSFIHFLSGIWLGEAFFLIDSPLVWALCVGIFLLVGWEIFEYLIDILDPLSNLLLDLALGVAGLPLVYKFLPLFPQGIVWYVFYATAFCTLASAAWGWSRYPFPWKTKVPK